MPWPRRSRNGSPTRRPNKAALCRRHPCPRQERGLDVTGITDETFWEQAEERIYAALQTYAEQAENGGGYQRRLFADDAARGFAFIDLCRKRFDVALMNPPFGNPQTQLLDLFRRMRQTTSIRRSSCVAPK